MKGRTSGAANMNHADRTPFAQQVAWQGLYECRDASHRLGHAGYSAADSADMTSCMWIVRRSSTARPGIQPRVIDSITSEIGGGTGIDPCEATAQNLVALYAIDLSVNRVAQPRRTFGNGVQHRLNIRR